MITTPLSFFGGTLDTDALAFIRASGVTGAYVDAINTMTIDLKRVGLWDKMDAIYPFAGNNATQHKWNLKNPLDTDAAFRLTFSGGWTHSGTGAYSNGTNAYAITYMPANGRGKQQVSFYINTSNTGTNQPSLTPIHMGAQGGAGRVAISAAMNTAGAGATAKNERWVGIGGFVTASATGTSGGFHLGTVAGGTLTYYKDNVKGPTATHDNVDTSTTRHILIGAQALSGTNTPNANSYAQDRFAFSSRGANLVDSEVTNLTNIVAAYVSKVGRT